MADYICEQQRTVGERSAATRAAEDVRDMKWTEEVQR